MTLQFISNIILETAVHLIVHFNTKNIKVKTLNTNLNCHIDKLMSRLLV